MQKLITHVAPVHSIHDMDYQNLVEEHEVYVRELLSSKQWLNSAWTSVKHTKGSE